MEHLTPRDSLCWSVTRTAAYVEAALGQCGLTPRQYRMLVAIAQGPVSATALAAQIGVAPPSATTMVRGLIQRGAVLREASTEDQRRIWLSVTDEGWRLLDEAETLTRAQLGRVADEMGSREEGEEALETFRRWNAGLDGYRDHWISLRGKRVVPREPRRLTRQRDGA